LSDAAPPSADRKVADVVDVTSTYVNVDIVLKVVVSHVPFPASIASRQQSQYPLIAIPALFPRICEHAIQELKLASVQLKQLGWHCFNDPVWSKNSPDAGQRPEGSR
jgi:hypothetical protein